MSVTHQGFSPRVLRFGSLVHRSEFKGIFMVQEFRKYLLREEIRIELELGVGAMIKARGTRKRLQVSA